MKPILYQAIRIQLKPSILMLGLLSFFSIASCSILLALPIAAMIKFAAILLVSISSVYFILRDILLVLPWSWQALEVDAKGGLTLSNRCQQQFQPILADSSFVHANLIILNFKRNGFRLALPPVILLPEYKYPDTDEVRRLRVWLRWARQSQDDLAAAD
jgi:hypothetical protein